MDEPLDQLPIEWPMDPTYDEWVGADGPRAWVGYKLKSADWYISTLEQVGLRVGFARFVGVEMALDGALAALCGAFDASYGAIIQAVETYFNLPPDGSLVAVLPVLQPHRYNWSACKKHLERLKGEGLALDLGPLIANVDAALTSQANVPLGWLTELQRLRNAAIHQNTLARHIDVTVDAVAGWSITVGRSVHGDGTEDQPGRAEHPVEYLHQIHGRLSVLTGRMIDVVEWLCPNGIPIACPVQSVTVNPATIQASAAVPTASIRAAEPQPDQD